jgi:hypothetical protein
MKNIQKWSANLRFLFQALFIITLLFTILFWTCYETMSNIFPPSDFIPTGINITIITSLIIIFISLIMQEAHKLEADAKHTI